MREVVIEEVPHGWRYGGTDYPSAVAAQRAVLEGSRDITRATGKTDVVAIHWHAVSRVGRTVVKAIT